MAMRTWILTDLDQDQSVANLTIGPDHAGGSASGYLVSKRTLMGGLRQGVEVIEVHNGAFRFVVIPTRGMGIWKAALGNLHLGWQSPVNGPVHPALVRLWEPSGIGWLDGFDELLVRCGLESNGAPEFHAGGAIRYPLHGRIANVPASRVELSIDGDAGQIVLRGVVDEARIFGSKLRLTTAISTQVGQPGMTVTDTVTNLSAEPSDMELLYHVNFGAPLCRPGAKVVLPIVKVAPRDEVAVGNVADWDKYGPETPGSQEAVFFADLAAESDGSTLALLRSPVGDQGASLRFNKKQLPCFTLWKNRQAAADGYVTGLEPATNYPNIKSFEKSQGRVVPLAPGESRTFEVTLEAHPTAASVQAAEAAIAKLQAGVKPEVLPKPQPGWSR